MQALSPGWDDAWTPKLPPFRGLHTPDSPVHAPYPALIQLRRDPDAPGDLLRNTMERDGIALLEQMAQHAGRAWQPWPSAADEPVTADALSHRDPDFWLELLAQARAFGVLQSHYGWAVDAALRLHGFEFAAERLFELVPIERASRSNGLASPDGPTVLRVALAACSASMPTHSAAQSARCGAM